MNRFSTKHNLCTVISVRGWLAFPWKSWFCDWLEKVLNKTLTQHFTYFTFTRRMPIPLFCTVYHPVSYGSWAESPTISLLLRIILLLSLRSARGGHALFRQGVALIKMIWKNSIPRNTFVTSCIVSQRRQARPSIDARQKASTTAEGILHSIKQNSNLSHVKHCPVEVGCWNKWR